MIKELKLWEILVPAYKGNSEESIKCHKEWDKKIIKIANGLTLGFKSVGKYVSHNDIMYEEAMLSVRIACSEDQIKEIMAATLEHHEQEAVFVSLVSEKVLILEKD